MTRGSTHAAGCGHRPLETTRGARGGGGEPEEFQHHSPTFSIHAYARQSPRVVLYIQVQIPTIVHVQIRVVVEERKEKKRMGSHPTGMVDPQDNSLACLLARSRMVSLRNEEKHLPSTLPTRPHFQVQKETSNSRANTVATPRSQTPLSFRCHTTGPPFLSPY